MDLKPSKPGPTHSEQRECFVAIKKGDLDTVKSFVQTFGVDAPVDDGTCLHQAVFGGHVSLAEYLLQAGADPNALYENRATPLVAAIDLGHGSIAALLVHAGARVNQKDALNNSPLSKAIFHYDGQAELIRLLLSKGADPYQDLVDGYRPIDLAESMNAPELLDLLNTKNT